ncbi:glycosyltransferase [Acinetobacter towneri]|uniref:glycosyltransferase n=1 Tax=Acinetobacter towneri TaxID=202956 RepID=UPI002574B9B5|nr:glycosyltransferase [Acinetobacter towneri]MDM1486790.1 glycosyltransferase [Acinetobacter towneri]
MNDKKKILFILDHLKGGGAEQISLDVANNLAKIHDVTIALLDAKNIRMPISGSINQIDLNINSKLMRGNLWRNKKLTLNDLNKIKILAENKYDLIVLSHWYALHLASYMDGNVWVWVHGEIFNPRQQPTNNLFRWYKEKRRVILEKKYFNKLLNGKNLIFVNKALKESYKPYIPQSKTKVIYNGIDEIRLKKDLNNTNEIKWDCIFIGRLSSEKQPEYAIKAFASSNLQGKMAVIGDGQLLEKLKNLAIELNVEKRIDFLGWQDKPAIFIKQSKILIMSSKQEGFGLVIAEAILLETPVIAFNCSEGVNYQLNTPTLSKGLVPPQDLDQLTVKLNEIYNHPYKISATDKKRLSIQATIKEFESLLQIKSD